MRIQRFTGMIAVPVALAACGGADGGSADWAGTVTDSAGVEVVQNPAAGTWAPGEEWALVEELSIGTLEADPEYQFGQIAGVDVDAAGNVYVADMQARDIRVYDAAGQYVRTIGSPGSGPGEFGMVLVGVFVVDEELVVPDLANARISRFTLDGELLGSDYLDMMQGVPLRWDMASGGRLVVQKRGINPNDTSVAPTGDPITTLVAGDEVPDTLAVLPAGASFQMQGGRPTMRMFDSEPMWDADPDGRLLTAMNTSMRFEVWNAAGKLQRVITRPFDARPVTERDQQVIRNGIREFAIAQGQPPQAVDAIFQILEFADSYPAFVSLALGPQSSIWVQRMRTGAELVDEEGTFDMQDLGSPEWEVFDDAGRYLGVVTFPGKYQPIRAIGDRFYGVARDELDVQSLKVYRVVPS